MVAYHYQLVEVRFFLKDRRSLIFDEEQQIVVKHDLKRTNNIERVAQTLNNLFTLSPMLMGGRADFFCVYGINNRTRGTTPPIKIAIGGGRPSKTLLDFNVGGLLYLYHLA